MRTRADLHFYELPLTVVEWPDFALYVVVQNLDDFEGVFTIKYTLTTADKEEAENQSQIIQRTAEEWEALNLIYYEGDVQLQLNPGEIGVAICPSDGIYLTADRVPFNHEHQIIAQQY